MNFIITKKVSWQVYRDTAYVFNEDNRKVYLFDDSAKEFWIAALMCQNEDAAILQLCSMYGEEFKEEISNDFREFITNLIRYDLMQEVV